MNQNNNQQPNQQINQQQTYQQSYQQQGYQIPVIPVIPSKKETKNKTATFFFSLFPGAGQMYQGLMKKGISLMTLFFGIIAISACLYTPAICLLLPIVWFYSFFDTINRMNMTKDELKAIKDDFILINDFSNNKAIADMMQKRHLFLGWAFIIIGIYAFLTLSSHTLANIFYRYDIDIYWRIMDVIKRTIAPILVSVACLVIGFKLIKSNSTKKENTSSITIEENKE